MVHSHHLSRALVAASLGLFFISLQTFAQGYSGGVGLSQNSLPAVEAADLLTAGFTAPAAVPAKENAYLTPVNYFTVGELAPNTEWGKAQNLVAVLVTPVPDPTWSYGAGQVEVLELNGRWQARGGRPGVYIVVTGPVKDAVEKLAGILKQKK
ncbi:hypothetical protein EPN90_01070 [Patescibacteria group bacterium]|nr:MAG: hypothetical protein EPN90_01070 [Patescibacteria group bacterium]